MNSIENASNYQVPTTIYTVSAILSIIAAIIVIVGMWKVFEKAGEPGWAALIPFYNLYILFKIGWGNGWMFLTMLLAIIPIVGSIAYAVFYIMNLHKISCKFGHGAGYTCGLLLLGPVFWIMLGFGESKCIG